MTSLTLLWDRICPIPALVLRLILQERTLTVVVVMLAAICPFLIFSFSVPMMSFLPVGNTIAVVAAITVLALFGMRPRVSLQGEAAILTQILGPLIAAVCAPFASLCLLLITAMAVSVMMVSGIWFGWSLAWLLTWAAIVLFYLTAIAAGLAVLTAIVLAKAEDDAGIAVQVAVGCGVSCLFIAWLTASLHGVEFDDVLDTRVIGVHEARTAGIPGLTVLYDGALDVVRRLNLTDATSLAVSIGVGVGIGAGIGVAARRLRQWSMRSPLARDLIPLAAAPLPDATPLVATDKRISFIVALLLVIGGWICVVMLW